MTSLETETLLMGLEAETFAAEVFRTARGGASSDEDALEGARTVLLQLYQHGLITLWAAIPLEPGVEVETGTRNPVDLLSRDDWLQDTVGHDGLALVFETSHLGEQLLREGLGWGEVGN